MFFMTTLVLGQYLIKIKHKEGKHLVHSNDLDNGIGLCHQFLLLLPKSHQM